MFVLQSTHDKVIQQLMHEQHTAIQWQCKHSELQTRWNDLVQQINDKGGRDFLLHGKIDRNAPKTIHQFNDYELLERLRG